VQRRTLVPVPDMLMYKDQLEEVNELTARIARCRKLSASRASIRPALASFRTPSKRP